MQPGSQLSRQDAIEALLLNYEALTAHLHRPRIHTTLREQDREMLEMAFKAGFAALPVGDREDLLVDLYEDASPEERELLDALHLTSRTGEQIARSEDGGAADHLRL